MHPPTAMASGLGAPFLPFPYPLRAAAVAAASDQARGPTAGPALTQLHPAFLPQYPFYTGPGMLGPGFRPAFLHQPPEKSKSFTIDAILGKAGDKTSSGAERSDGRGRVEGRDGGDGRGVETAGATGAGHPYLRSITCPTALRYGSSLPGAGLELSKGRSLCLFFVTKILFCFVFVLCEIYKCI